MRILIAEDDAALASFVKKGLEAEHYAVDVSGDGEQARAMAAEFDYDLVVLDLNLPRVDGVTILRYLRTRKSSMPILILTGRTRVEDRVQCLDLGADDYLLKPFSFSELSARIRALMRRSHLPAESMLAVDDLKLDRVERRVERNGRRIELTSKEFALLEYLMRNAGRRITRAMIIEHVWNLSFDTATNVVDVYINYLLQTADSTLNSVVLALQRAITLGVEGATGTLSDSNRASLAEEVSGIRDQLISLANLSFQGRFVFAGTASQTKPFAVDATQTSGVRYDGNAGVNFVSIGEGLDQKTNLPGSDIFMAPGSDMFQATTDLITSLQSGAGIDVAVVSARKAFDFVTAQRVFFGNAVNQIEGQQTYLNTQKLQLSQQQNDVGGADLASAASNLVNAQNARAATLEAIARVAQLSLFDYLR